MLRAHKDLPGWLQVPFVPLATVLFIIIIGLAFTLPPGPLCDEGMIWFMEGGCDWGGSNIFFFSKLGLLVVMNVLALRVSLSDPTLRRAFLPHVVVLLVMAVALVPGEDECATYYGHPNGNYTQMLLEQASFALLVLASFGVSWRWPSFARAAAIVGLNGIHVLLFSLCSEVTPHWTWLHTTLLSGAMLGLAVLAVVVGRRVRRRSGARAQG